ncbi:uncharacterized protein DDB_G0290685-like [Physella acuta]|uniref:uncharacterized protein DDB_G0290685-like n=1 Tax=Physella acuta TaxID=109671 RepID=UPI0027DC1C1D|nr:uncharacterized protein DDB_G0290685-like [Physella acuta]
MLSADPVLVEGSRRLPDLKMARKCLKKMLYLVLLGTSAVAVYVVFFTHSNARITNEWKHLIEAMKVEAAADQQDRNIDTNVLHRPVDGNRKKYFGAEDGASGRLQQKHGRRQDVEEHTKHGRRQEEQVELTYGDKLIQDNGDREVHGPDDGDDGGDGDGNIHVGLESPVVNAELNGEEEINNELNDEGRNNIEVKDNNEDNDEKNDEENYEENDEENEVNVKEHKTDARLGTSQTQGNPKIEAQKLPLEYLITNHLGEVVGEQLFAEGINHLGKKGRLAERRRAEQLRRESLAEADEHLPEADEHLPEGPGDGKLPPEVAIEGRQGEPTRPLQLNKTVNDLQDGNPKAADTRTDLEKGFEAFGVKKGQVNNVRGNAAEEHKEYIPYAVRHGLVKAGKNKQVAANNGQQVAANNGQGWANQKPPVNGLMENNGQVADGQLANELPNDKKYIPYAQRHGLGPQKLMQGGNGNQQNVPDQNVPEQNVPEQNVPEQNVPEQNVPEQNVPEQNVPEQWMQNENGQNQALQQGHFGNLDPIEALPPAVLAAVLKHKQKELIEHLQNRRNLPPLQRVPVPIQQGNNQGNNQWNNQAQGGNQVEEDNQQKVEEQPGDNDLHIEDLSEPLPVTMHCVQFRFPTGLAPLCLHPPAKDSGAPAKMATDGSYEREIMEQFYQIMSQDPSLGLVDVGSHVGVYVIAAALMQRNVLAVEPMFQNFRLLHKSAQENKVTDRVVLVAQALDDTTYVGQLAYPDDGTYSQINISRLTPGLKHDPAHIVHVTTLNKLVPAFRFQRALLKLDVSAGMEARILAASESFFAQLDVPYVLTSWTWGANPQGHQLTHALLSGRGYRPRLGWNGAEVNEEYLKKDLPFLVWKKA